MDFCIRDCVGCGNRGGGGGVVKGQLTTLSARILETEVFFQIRKVDDFAGGELARSTGKRKRIGISSNTYLEKIRSAFSFWAVLRNN